jgi:oligopeptide transport system substrate-binding protein
VGRSTVATDAPTGTVTFLYAEEEEVIAMASSVSRTRLMLRHAAASFAIVWLLVLLVGCGAFQEQGTGQQGGGGNPNTLRFNLQAEIPDLNSTTTTDASSVGVLNNVMEGLYRLDEDQQPQPAMAKSVEISDDKLTYTFTLRDGVKWSNGDPVTAQDFEYAWLRAMDPETAGQFSFIVSDYIRGGSEFSAGESSAEDVAIETPDDRTLKVTLENPTPFFLGLTALPAYLPQNQDFVERQGERYAQSAETLLYNGPYTLTELHPTESATFVKNEDYWDKENVDIERVEGKVVKDVATAVNLYEAGELDVTELSGEYVDEYEGSPALEPMVMFATSYLNMNQDNPAFRNENIRKAMQIGFDRDALADEILNDGSVVAEGLVPPGMDSGGPGEQTFREAAPEVLGGFDPERARELYQQGVEEIGEEPNLTLLVWDDSRERDVSTFLQSQFEENLGAKVEVRALPFDRLLEQTAAGDYDFYHIGWWADYNDPMTFLDVWTTDSPFNQTGFSNAEYDRLIADAKAETDPTRRFQQLAQAEKILIEDEAVIAPTFHQGFTRLIRPSVEGLVFHPYGTFLDFKYGSIRE